MGKGVCSIHHVKLQAMGKPTSRLSRTFKFAKKKAKGKKKSVHPQSAKSLFPIDIQLNDSIVEYTPRLVPPPPLHPLEQK